MELAVERCVVPFDVGVERWKPWTELRAREHLVFGLCTLPTKIRGLYIPGRPKAFIMVDSALDQCWRKAVLAHELVHDERDGGCVLEGMPEQWRAVAAREEARVWREVARRMVPAAEISAMREISVLNHLPLETWHVAEHMDVPEFVAALGVELAQRAAA